MNSLTVLEPGSLTQAISWTGSFGSLPREVYSCLLPSFQQSQATLASFSLQLHCASLRPCLCVTFSLCTSVQKPLCFLIRTPASGLTPHPKSKVISSQGLNLLTPEEPFQRRSLMLGIGGFTGDRWWDLDIYSWRPLDNSLFS